MSNLKRSKSFAVRMNQRLSALFVIPCSNLKSKYLLFLILCAAMLPVSMPGQGNNPLPGQTSVMLIVPSRPLVLQLYFDLAQIRDITLVAYRRNPVAAEPLIHVWTGNEWQPVGFDDFCSLRFVKQAPDTAIIVGDDQTVPATLLQGMHWPCKIARAQTVEITGLMPEFDQYFHFNAREREVLTDQYGLKPEVKAAAQSEPPLEENTGKPGKSGLLLTGAAEKSAAVISGRSPDGVREEDGIFRLALGEDEYIVFVWIQPLSIWVGRYEVTNAQYKWFNRAHDPKKYYDHILDMTNQPAVFVSWEDANNYCGWLNRNFRSQLPPGWAARLPTEKEWIVFAACGQDKKYPWGDYWPPPNALNYKGKEGEGMFYNLIHNERFIWKHEDGFVVTAPVGKSGTNEWGLYGVGGNVWEWCQDWFDDAKTTRVLRGAAWNNYEPVILTISNRSDALPEKSNAMIGFRVVIAPLKKRQKAE